MCFPCNFCYVSNVLVLSPNSQMRRLLSLKNWAYWCDKTRLVVTFRITRTLYEKRQFLRFLAFYVMKLKGGYHNGSCLLKLLNVLPSCIMTKLMWEDLVLTVRFCHDKVCWRRFLLLSGRFCHKDFMKDLIWRKASEYFRHEVDVSHHDDVDFEKWLREFSSRTRHDDVCNNALSIYER